MYRMASRAINFSKTTKSAGFSGRGDKRSVLYQATRVRKSSGSAITEFGPAVGIVLLVILFPLIDLLGMTVSYGCVWYLNHLQSREAALTLRVRNGALAPNSQAESNQAIATVATNWSRSGLGQFAKAKSISQSVSLVSDPSAGNAAVGSASVTTTVRVDPFLTIPFFVAVPGLNQEITFVLTSTRPVEDNAGNPNNQAPGAPGNPGGTSQGGAVGN